MLHGALPTPGGGSATLLYIPSYHNLFTRSHLPRHMVLHTGCKQTGPMFSIHTSASLTKDPKGASQPFNATCAAPAGPLLQDQNTQQHDPIGTCPRLLQEVPSKSHCSNCPDLTV